MPRKSTKTSKRVFVSSLMIAALALIPTAQAATKPNKVPDNLLIVPGKRIGRIFIGDTRGAVRHRLGALARTFKLGANLKSELWRAGKYTLEVVYRNGTVTQIETTNPTFQTAQKVGRSNQIADWEDVLDLASKVSFYRYANKPRQEYWDWIRDGLTLETEGSEIDNNHAMRILTVIVHRSNASVIPDIGGKKTDWTFKKRFASTRAHRTFSIS